MFCKRRSLKTLNVKMVFSFIRFLNFRQNLTLAPVSYFSCLIIRVKINSSRACFDLKSRHVCFAVSRFVSPILLHTLAVLHVYFIISPLTLQNICGPNLSSSYKLILKTNRDIYFSTGDGGLSSNIYPLK